MDEQRKTATLVRRLTGFRGDARLFKVDPPIEQRDWNDNVEATHEYVVVSAAEVMFSGPETYIFPGNADGEVVDWGELNGSFKGSLDHAAALRGAGYEIADVIVVAESAARKAVTS